jgi:ubiquinone/menaquinone biosynthesis C-methylase UbiE
MGRDPYSMTDQLDGAMLQVIVDRLEARGRHPVFEEMLQKYLTAMNIDSAKTVLDLGCGTGVAARSIARRAGFVGRVTGIDLGPGLIDVARRLSQDEGLGAKIDYRVGDTRSLDVADASFDALVAHTLLSHVADPAATIREAARVVRPGGMLGLCDGDFASLNFATPDVEAGKSADEKIIAAIFTNARVMRQMPRLLRATGLELVSFHPFVIADAGAADFWAPAINSFRKLAPQGGTMSASEAEAWADAQMQYSAAGEFFAACNHYAYVARKP